MTNRMVKSTAERLARRWAPLLRGANIETGACGCCHRLTYGDGRVYILQENDEHDSEVTLTDMTKDWVRGCKGSG